MKRHRLFFLTLLSLLMVLCTLARAGWLHARHGWPNLSGAVRSHSSQRVQDPLVSSSALRWRQGLPSHWRACLLQR